MDPMLVMDSKPMAYSIHAKQNVPSLCFFKSMTTYKIINSTFSELKKFIFFFLKILVHTFQPVSFKNRDNGPPSSVTKILKNQTSRLLENALPTIKPMSKQLSCFQGITVSCQKYTNVKGNFVLRT